MAVRKWDKDTLYTLYHIGGKTLEEIANHYGVTKQRISQVMEELGIPRSAKGRKRKVINYKYNDLQSYFNGERKQDSVTVLKRLLPELVCEECGGDKNLHIHHINYPANSLEDIQVLCASCHFIKHRKGLTWKRQLEVYYKHRSGVPIKDILEEYNIAKNTLYAIKRKVERGAKTYRDTYSQKGIDRE